jgi:hypothetical protein
MRVRALALTARLFVLGAASAAPRLSQDAVDRTAVGAELLRRGEIQEVEQARKLYLANAMCEIEVHAEYGPV